MELVEGPTLAELIDQASATSASKTFGSGQPRSADREPSGTPPRARPPIAGAFRSTKRFRSRDSSRWPWKPRTSRASSTAI